MHTVPSGSDEGLQRIESHFLSDLENHVTELGDSCELTAVPANEADKVLYGVQIRAKSESFEKYHFSKISFCWTLRRGISRIVPFRRSSFPRFRIALGLK